MTANVKQIKQRNPRQDIRIPRHRLEHRVQARLVCSVERARWSKWYVGLVGGKAREENRYWCQVWPVPRIISNTVIYIVLPVALNEALSAALRRPSEVVLGVKNFPKRGWSRERKMTWAPL